MSSEASDASSSWYEILGWLEVHKKQLAWAGVGMLALVFALIVYEWNARQAERAANDALLQLRANSQPGRAEAAATADDFLKVAREYPGASAAERALLLAGGARFGEGKYPEAQTLFNEFLQKHGSHPLTFVAAQGVAASLEAQDKKDEALAAYQNVLTRFSKSPFVDEAKLAMARLYEAKDQPELALQTYDEIAKTGAMSSAGNQASQRKQHLLTLHPGLVKTNATEAPKIISPDSPTNAVASPPAKTASDSQSSKP